MDWNGYKDWNIKNNPIESSSNSNINSNDNINSNINSDNNINPSDSEKFPMESSKRSDSISMDDDNSSSTKRRKVRAKYSRPCDGCALRKVRCDQRKPCSRCIEHNVPCTDNRTRKKCGPKHIHQKTRDSISSLSLGNGKINTLGNYNEILTLDKLLPCLQIYQTWYYGIWPVLSVAHLVSRIVQLNPSCDSTLNTENATSYSLCCAVCAAIQRQLSFLTTGNPIANAPHNIDASEYAKESIRARNLYDYRLEPSHDNLLISFFLYIYYVNVQGGIRAAILYMKEAISIAQLLGLHDPRTYISRPSAEVHRLRKIYYMLLVTERFMCIEDNVPVCLEPSIPLPSLEDEEYSGLLTGFIELVKIFSIPDKKFFDNLINYSKKNPSNLNHFQNLFESSGIPTKKWIISVQTELSKIEISNASSDTQRLNILLSKYWMKSLAWHISSQNGLLIKKAKEPEEFCLTPQFPLKLAKEFLIGTENLPIFAFESNGPGVCVKLLEIANAVADSFSESVISKSDTFTAFNILTSVFSLVSKFKNDITISQDLYQKVESIVNRRSAPTPANTKSYIREINDDGESINSNESDNSSPQDRNVERDIISTAVDKATKPDQSKSDLSDFKYFDPHIQLPSIVQSPDFSPPPLASPFTQMSMAFSLSPNSGQVHQNHQMHASGNESSDLNLDIFKTNHNHFQTLNQTPSPSAQQLHQLELQLQHQFQQLQPNQYNEYQYGPIDIENSGTSGRGTRNTIKSKASTPDNKSSSSLNQTVNNQSSTESAPTDSSDSNSRSGDGGGDGGAGGAGGAGANGDTTSTNSGAGDTNSGNDGKLQEGGQFGLSSFMLQHYTNPQYSGNSYGLSEEKDHQQQEQQQQQQQQHQKNEENLTLGGILSSTISSPQSNSSPHSHHSYHSEESHHSHHSNYSHFNDTEDKPGVDTSAQIHISPKFKKTFTSPMFSEVNSQSYLVDGLEEKLLVNDLQANDI